ncbi:hypothetical protein J3R82DRAFT_9130 [Butyriboletus roseoflavus]|nr:hypothetical protein J3R82DRAFT_9130 [Butyriboletus roseoflavus]
MVKSRRTSALRRPFSSYLSRSYLIRGHLGGVEVVQTRTFALPDVDTNPAPNIGPSGDSVSGSIRPIVRELVLSEGHMTWDRCDLPSTPSRSVSCTHTHLSILPRYACPTCMHRRDHTLAASHTGPISATVEDNHPNDDTHSNSNNNNNNNKSGFNAAPKKCSRSPPHRTTFFFVQGLWKGNLIDLSSDEFVQVVERTRVRYVRWDDSQIHRGRCGGTACCRQ